MPVTPKFELLARDLQRGKTAATRADLIETYGRRAFCGARSAGLVVEALPHIYVSHRNIELMTTRITAASRWIVGRGVLSGVASCVVHGLKAYSSEAITVLSDGTKLRAAPDWLRLRRLSFEVPSLIHSGHPVATLPHALVQAWWDEGPDIGKGLIIEATRKRPHVTRQVRDASTNYSRLPQRKQLLAFLGALGGGIESYLEHLADTTILNVPDLRGLRKQVRVSAGNRQFRVDAFDDKNKIAIEFDGAEFHSNDSARRRDLERDAILSSLGIITLRFTYEDVTQRPHWCRQVIRSTITNRSAA